MTVTHGVHVRLRDPIGVIPLLRDENILDHVLWMWNGPGEICCSEPTIGGSPLVRKYAGKLAGNISIKGRRQGADIWSMPHNPPDQQSTGASLKRTRAKQSCTRCRKQKVKCSGKVPCERCVRCNEADSCELWNRVAGRPKTAVTLEKLEACAYYRPVLVKVAMDFAHRGQPAPDLVVQLARLWLMVVVHQKDVNKEFVKAEIARRTLIPIAHFKVSAHFYSAKLALRLSAPLSGCV